MKKRYTILFVLFILINPKLKAQISQGGTPTFLNSKTKSTIQIPLVKMPKMNNDSLLYRDMQQKSNRKGMNFAAAINTDLNINNSGKWINLGSEKVWLLELESETATSLNFILNYKLNPGAKLFIFNKTSGKVLGAYTSDNNKDWGRLAIQPIIGDNVIFEYHVPNEVDKGTLGIKTVGHGYLENYVNTIPDTFNDFGRSKECQYDINGEKGQSWQQEKRSVVKIVIQVDSYTFLKSSGNLINNTNNDQKPYILTCEHSINSRIWGTDPDYTPQMGAENSVYLFNYESKVIGEDGDQTQTISGANLRATKPDLDFALLELSIPVPEAYKPYFAGWDRRNQDYDFCVGISHPKADVKKIIKSKSKVVSNKTFNELESYIYNTHFQIIGWDYGQNESGSSGSGLFNSDHRIIGDLSGGTTRDCGENDIKESNYQMMYYYWANNEVKSQQLKAWLDPNNSGVEFMDGLDPYREDEVYMYPDKELCYINEPIVFSDHSKGTYTNYRWNFGDNAIPSTATGKDPVTVSYNSTGTYSASLTVTNSQGIDETFTLTNYIEVFYREASVDFEVSTKSANTGEEVVFTNLSSGSNTSYEWDFGEGAEPRTLVTSSTEPISVIYSTTGKKDISLVARNPLGDKTITNLKLLEIGEELVADFTIDEGPYFVGDNINVKSTTDKWDAIGYGCWWSLDDEMVSNYSELTYTYNFNKAGKYKLEFIVTSYYDRDTAILEIEVHDHIKASPIITAINDNTIECSIENRGENETYHWDFGDGNTSDEETLEHTFNEIGTYDINLTISNDIEQTTITSQYRVSSIPTGIEDEFENLSNNELKVYPNPATEFVNVEFPNNWKQKTIQVYSLTGKLIYSKQVKTTSLKINCNDLTKGLNLIEIINENEITTRKVLIH